MINLKINLSIAVIFFNLIANIYFCNAQDTTKANNGNGKMLNYFEEKKKIYEKDNKFYNSLDEKRKKRIKRDEWFWDTRIDEKGNINTYADQLEKATFEFSSNNKIATGAAGTNAITSAWTAMGPFNGNFSDNYNFTGRVQCIEVDDARQRILIGTHGGGFWKSTNGGSTWTCKTENLFSGGVYDIAVDPCQSQTIYLATGTYKNGLLQDGLVTGGFYYGHYSNGIWKSRDGGETFVKFEITGVNPESLILLQGIAVNPNKCTDVFLIAAKSMYKSADRGVTWSAVTIPALDPTECLRKIVFLPGDSKVMFVSGDGVVLRSTDSGLTWFDISLNVRKTAFFRSTVAVSPNNPTESNSVWVIYNQTADCDPVGGLPLSTIKKSTDKGGTWLNITNNTSADMSIYLHCQLCSVFGNCPK